MAAAVPKLDTLVRRGSDGHRLLTIVRLMRNSIHGEALSATGFIVGPRPLETMAGLPEEDREEVGAAMDGLGGRAAWGADDPEPGASFRLHPGEFVERLLPRAISLLDDLTAAVSVEQPDPANHEPDRWSKRRRVRSLFEDRTLWQLGLE